MEQEGEGTLSLHSKGGVERRRENVSPYLFLVTQAGTSHELPWRMRLDELDEIHVCRASRRCVELQPNGVQTHLHIGVVDKWMSTTHARLIRTRRGWQLVDHDTKNGTRINGRRQRSVILRDGDLLEMGRTFFVFRADLATRAGAPRYFDGGKIEALPGLGTMLPGLAWCFDELVRLAASRASILLQGPTGSGKELLARAVHTLSGRHGAFIAVNCAGLPEALVDGELFGHVSRGFTGIDGERKGLLAASGGGTLFLDEIGDLPLTAQARLLRALQENTVRPVGSDAELHVDLRVVCATHRDLEGLVGAGSFREDLFARLGSNFELPSLCERREDLGLLMDGLFKRIDASRARGVELSVEAVRAILSYAWPRNIRELERVLERALALAGTGPIELAHLPAELRLPAPPSRIARGSTRSMHASGEDQTTRALPSKSPRKADESSAEEGTFKYDLFIIHADADRPFVRGDLLPAVGVPPGRVLLSSGLALGAPWSTELERGVLASRLTIVVLSPAFMTDRWAELGELLAGHVSGVAGRLVPLLLADCELPPRLDFRVPLDFRDPAQWADEAQRLRAHLQQPVPGPAEPPHPHPALRPCSADAPTPRRMSRT